MEQVTKSPCRTIEKSQYVLWRNLSSPIFCSRFLERVAPLTPHIPGNKIPGVMASSRNRSTVRITPVDFHSECRCMLPLRASPVSFIDVRRLRVELKSQEDGQPPHSWATLLAYVHPWHQRALGKARHLRRVRPQADTLDPHDCPPGCRLQDTTERARPMQAVVEQPLRTGVPPGPPALASRRLLPYRLLPTTRPGRGRPSPR